MKKKTTVKGMRTLSSASSMTNALHFFVESMIHKSINTAEVVRVVAVDAGGADRPTGYVDVLPLVCRTDADNRKIMPTPLYRLPYSRIQGGVAALVIDPVPGDIGLAVFTKRDSSPVVPGTTDPVQPGSFRTFDQADGFYFGGFLNQKPSIYLELDQDKNARLVAPESVRIETRKCTVECEEFTVNASVSAGINSPSWSFNTYDGSGRGRGTINADLTQTGGLASTGDHTAAGVSLQNHVHGGVQTGSGSTSTPR